MRLLCACALVVACSSSPGGSHPGGDPGGTPDGEPPGSFSPIAPSTFVFATEKPAGQTRLYAHDLTTHTTTTLVTFDPSSSIGGLAISPDRTVIAFTGLVRPEPSEAQVGYPADSVWTVRSDGTTFHRVTHPLPAITPPGTAFHIAMLEPTWSVD